MVTFCSKGMFDTLRKFSGTRAHVIVDTKMKVLKRQRGVATVFLAVKDGLRPPSFHTGAGRKQGRALTTHALPVLQAIMDAESTLNHVDLFAALRHLWGEAHPDGPEFSSVFRQMGKDFAPGIEAARESTCPFMRPMDDFFPFHG